MVILLGRNSKAENKTCKQTTRETSPCGALNASLVLLVYLFLGLKRIFLKKFKLNFDSF
jgi:hypothetical protein